MSKPNAITLVIFYVGLCILLYTYRRENNQLRYQVKQQAEEIHQMSLFIKHGGK